MNTIHNYFELDKMELLQRMYEKEIVVRMEGGMIGNIRSVRFCLTRKTHYATSENLEALLNLIIQYGDKPYKNFYTTAVTSCEVFIVMCGELNVWKTTKSEQIDVTAFEPHIELGHFVVEQCESGLRIWFHEADISSDSD